MSMSPDINSFIIQFENVLDRCAIFESSDNIHVAVQRVSTKGNGEIVYIGRGLDEREIEIFRDNKRKAREPLHIRRGGEFKFIIKMNTSHADLLEKYSFRFLDLRRTINGVRSLRFDKDLNTPRGRNDWDDDMKDAPSHPAHHLHVNFDEDNHMRLPIGLPKKCVSTAKAYPLMIIASIDYWYRNVLSE